MIIFPKINDPAAMRGLIHLITYVILVIVTVYAFFCGNNVS